MKNRRKKILCFSVVLLISFCVLFYFFHNTIPVEYKSDEDLLLYTKTKYDKTPNETIVTLYPKKQDIVVISVSKKGNKLLISVVNDFKPSDRKVEIRKKGKYSKVVITESARIFD